MIGLVLGLLFAIFLVSDVAEPHNQGNPLSSHDTAKEQDSKNCQPCEAGYFQQKTCEIPEGKPTCSPCPFGTFMKLPNNERKCHKCKECSKGFEEKTPCNPTNDRECRCTSGMFQDRDGEICSKCKDCDGWKVEKECTENGNTVCSIVPVDEANTDKPHSPGMHPDNKTDIGVGLGLGIGLSLGLILVVLLVLSLCWIFCKRKKKNSFGKEKEIAEDSRQNNEMTAGKDLPGNWKDIVNMNVKLEVHRKLVRKLGLKDCKIDEIQNDYPLAAEQKYELLRAWENQIGNYSNKLKEVVEGLCLYEQRKAAYVLVRKATPSTVEEQLLLE